MGKNKDKETFYFRGSNKGGYVRSFLLAEVPKTALTKKDVILLEIKNVKGKLTTIAVTPEESIIISSALLCAWTEWNCKEYNKRYKKLSDKNRNRKNGK